MFINETSLLWKNISLAKLCSTQYLATKGSSSTLLSSDTWFTSGTLEKKSVGHYKTYFLSTYCRHDFQLNQCAIVVVVMCGRHKLLFCLLDEILISLFCVPALHFSI